MNDILTFKTAEQFEKYLKTKETAPDYVKIENMIFTMDEYDMEGKEVTYGTKTHNKTMFLTTENRYKTKYQDVKIEIADAVCFRNGINYL